MAKCVFSKSEWQCVYSYEAQVVNWKSYIQMWLWLDNFVVSDWMIECYVVTDQLLMVVVSVGICLILGK